MTQIFINYNFKKIIKLNETPKKEFHKIMWCNNN